jgi:hypothetical protein
MGDRGNIYVVQHPHREPEGGIFIYTHWGGHKLPELLQSALKTGKSRWNDEPYLTRVIFDAVSVDNEGITGVGLTTYLTDNEYPILVVDSEKQTVGVAGRVRGNEPLGEPRNVVSFEKFCELSEEELENFREAS